MSTKLWRRPKGVASYVPRKQSISVGRSATLTIPELEQSKTGVLNTLASVHSRRSYAYAIKRFDATTSALLPLPTLKLTSPAAVRSLLHHVCRESACDTRSAPLKNLVRVHSVLAGYPRDGSSRHHRRPKIFRFSSADRRCRFTTLASIASPTNSFCSTQSHV